MTVVERALWRIECKLEALTHQGYVLRNDMWQTGEATVTATGLRRCMVIDLDMERCPMCHAEMEIREEDLVDSKSWWCPMCNHEVEI